MRHPQRTSRRPGVPVLFVAHAGSRYQRGSWRTEAIGEGMDERLGGAIPSNGQRHWRRVVDVGGANVAGGQVARYILLHLANSDDGRMCTPP
jgi:hypothetical protein